MSPVDRPIERLPTRERIYFPASPVAAMLRFGLSFSGGKSPSSVAILQYSASRTARARRFRSAPGPFGLESCNRLRWFPPMFHRPVCSGDLDRKNQVVAAGWILRSRRPALLGAGPFLITPRAPC
jgi:hypothetical protein